MAVVLTSYSTGYDTDAQTGNGTVVGFAESIATNGSPLLYSAKASFKKVGSPTGNLTANIYAYTGTLGSSAVPTGSALATSASLNVTTLTTSSVNRELLFTGANAINLTSDNYMLAFQYSGGNSSNYVEIQADTSTPTYPGNFAAHIGGTWSASTDEAILFAVLGVYTPVSSFTPSQTNVALSESITFTDTSINTPTSWSWDFGDSSTDSTDQNPTHAYSSAGTYTVTLTATNDAGDDTATATITVEDKPTFTGLSSLTGVSSITFS